MNCYSIKMLVFSACLMFCEFIEISQVAESDCALVLRSQTSFLCGYLATMKIAKRLSTRKMTKNVIQIHL